MFFPAYFVLKFLLSEKGTCLVESSSSAPDSAESIFFKTSSGLKGIIVNFYNSNNEVEIENLSRKSKYLQLTSESYPDASGNENWIENPSIWKSAETNIILQKPYSITFLQECF
jgi:hypothetical protein